MSPRYNFMGDFFLLDLERRIEPIVLHFVNAPKPWKLDAWKGEARFAENYRDWFARLALAGLGEGARGAGVAAVPAAAHPCQARLRQAPRFIYRADVIY